MRKITSGWGCALLLTFTSASAEVMVGAYVPNDGFSREEIQLVNSTVPKSLAFINIFSSFSHSWDHLYWQAGNSVAEGAQPLISWMPIDLQRPDDNLLPEIAIGLHDAYIDEWADKLKAWVNQYDADAQPTILLRFAHEFNGNWYAYGNSPESFKMAWQYIHDRFKTAGIDQHIEWVWSANNVSVDDHNDVTAYYPGTEYVDWTSIDGYNFGSNYVWTTWESFEDTFSDIYITLVDNYPDKPILIAETGSAEPTDIPSAEWGQFGDDSDVNESKELWISDMFVKLESSFPAVRALTWFNTTKELGWSLTDDTSTGMASFIAGIQSDYFTEEFLTTKDVGESVVAETTEEPDTNSGSEAPVDDVAVPTDSELRLELAKTTYTELQSEYATAHTSWSEASDSLDAAELLNNSRLSEQAEAKQQLDSIANNYTTVRNNFLSASSALNEARDDYGGIRASSFIKRDNFKHAVETLDISATSKKIILNRFIRNRALFGDSRAVFEQARADLVDKYLDLTIAREDGMTGDELHPFKDEVGKVREAFNVAFADFYEKRENFRDSISEIAVSRKELHQAIRDRNTTRDEYRDIIIARKVAWKNTISALNERADVLERLIVLKKDLDVSNTVFQTVSLALVNSAADLQTLQQDEASKYSILQDAEDALTSGHTELTSAQQLVSLEDASNNNPLILSDFSNLLVLNDGDDDRVDDDDRDDDQDNDKEDKDNKDQDKADKPEQKVVKKAVKMDAKEQRNLAQSVKPKGLDPEKLARRHEKYNQLTVTEKKKVKQIKMSIIDY